MGNVFEPIAAGISTAGSVASTALTNKANRDIAAQNNATQIQIANQNNQMQRELNAENNQFSHDEAELAFDRSVEQWQRENQYNTPVEQLKRFQEAGINPTLGLLGNSAMPAANSPAATMAQPHGSGITPSMPQLQQAVMNPFDIGDSLMKGITALANARKTGLESKSLQETMDSIISKAKSDAKFAENQADLSEFQNYLQQRYGEKRFTAETQKLLDDAYLSTSLAFKAQREGDLALAQEYREKAHTDVLKLDKELKIKERDNYDELYDLRKNQIIADTEKSKAEGEKARQEAITEDQLRDYRRDLLSSDKRVADESANKFAAEVSHYALINNLIPQGTDQMKYREAVLKQIQEDVKSKEFENTWTGRIMRSLAGPASNVAAATLFMVPKL